MDLNYYYKTSRGATSGEKQGSLRTHRRKALALSALVFASYLTFASKISCVSSVESIGTEQVDTTQFTKGTDESSNYKKAEDSPISRYQPTLTGFRCEAQHETTPGGISVIEANRPITLTLFGESFTTETIVAFTTEFRLELGSRAETNNDHEQVVMDGKMRSHSLSQQGSTNRLTRNMSSAASETLPSKSEGTHFIKRAKNYDCTDYDRVVSYKLGKENILSPKVATIVATLPELALGTGLYYYFCIKQPKMLASKLAGSSVALAPVSQVNESSLVWVHQGDDWWVTLKVEPPILTMTNDCILIVLLLFLSAVTSGLNLGLMSLDMNELAVISSCGDQRERSYARTIAPLRRRGNFLLCSLLLGNVMVNSTLTVILEDMTSGLIAVIGSTLAIVILGEIVPQAMCARHGLAIGAKTIYMTYAFMLLTFPLSYPISCLLDFVLGEEKGNVYDRERLMEFIKITGHHTQLEADEVAIISGALKLKKIKVDQIMTRIEDVFMLPIDCQLNRETIRRIIEKGYSRIPVYEYGDRKQIVALILAKDLALLDPDDHTPIASMLMYCKHPLIFIEDDATLDVALNEFKTGKSHMAVVRQIYDDGETDKYYEAIGVVTLEDVIEEVLQVEINDETDTLSDNRRKRRRTEAQVAHLVDELALAGSHQAFTLSPLDPCQKKLSLAPGVASSDGQHLAKEVQTSLASHLGSVSVGAFTSALAANSIRLEPPNSERYTPLPPSDNSGHSSSFQTPPGGLSLSMESSSSPASPPDNNNADINDNSDDGANNNPQGVLSRAAQFFGGMIL